MTEEDSIAREQRRLRGLIALAKETGTSELRIEHDPSMSSVHLRLDARQLVPAKQQVTDPDERAELDEEEERLSKVSAEERAHNKYWRRITRSSGAPIPPFKPPKEAQQ